MMSSREKRSLKMKSNSYVLVSRILFRINFEGVLLRCLPIEKNHEILTEMQKENVEDTFPQELLHITLLELVIISQLFLRTYMLRLKSAQLVKKIQHE